MLSAVSAHWFALQVKCRFERAVALALKSKGYEEFLPVYTSRPKTKHNSKPSESPLFPGYVFCRINRNAHGPIVTTPGVLRVVGFGSVPATVSEDEIESIRMIVNSDVPSRPCHYISTGQRVQIVDGPLKGLTGFVVKSQGECLVVVSVELLNRSVAVGIDRQSLDVLPESYEETGNRAA